MMKKMWLSLLMLCCLSAVAGCAPSQLRYRQEMTSRDYNYIDFIRNSEPLTFVSEVGGEHMTFYKVLAFQGDTFRITVVDLEGRTAPAISGEGIEVRKGSDSSVFQRIVEVQDPDALFYIELDAHPFGRYRLEIEKL